MSSDPLLEGAAPTALDDRDGPARRLSPDELDNAARAAVGRAMPVQRRFGRRKLQFLLLAATLCIAGVSTAFFLQRSPPPASPPVPPEVRTVGPIEGAKPPEARGESRPAVPEAKAVSEPAPSRASVSAADLLKTANQLRRQGRWADAERAYAEVFGAYGGTAQGPVAALAAASLRLEHLGDPKGALRLYQSALRASSLSAEAELGIASSYRALGDRNAEIKSLRHLVSAYPQAVFHDRVSARLRALEAGTP